MARSGSDLRTGLRWECLGLVSEPMSLRAFGLVVLTGLACVANAMAESGNGSSWLRALNTRAAKFDSIVTVPEFETTPQEVRASVRDTIAAGNAALDRIGALKGDEVTFQNTAEALDDIGYQISLADNRLSLIKETSTNSAVRDSATDALKQLEEWMVGLDYREDVYRALKAYADKKPALTGEDAKLLSEAMRDYRRAGLELPKAGATRLSGCAKNSRA